MLRHLATRRGHGPKVACMVMLKNERMMARLFAGYHAALFGAENVYVFDNGSTDEQTRAELDRMQRLGIHIDRRFTSTGDFHRKATVLGDLIRRLEREADYDFYIPLDCDEFVVLRTAEGYTADPQAILGYLGQMRSQPNILHVTSNLLNVLGEMDTFQAAEYSKTVWPRGVFHYMDHGYHTGIARGGDSPYLPCDLVYAHFHNRPYEEVVEYAKQKLRVELSEEEIADHEKLREFRGLGWHMVHYITGGADAYYRQFRELPAPVVFPGLRERLAAIGLEPPHATFRLPPLPDPVAGRASPPALEPMPIDLLIDEATTVRVRGWAFDPATPYEPARLRFLVDGMVVWDGACAGSRPDVRAAGRLTDRVGFDFAILPEVLAARRPILTVENAQGLPVRMSVEGHARDQVTLAWVAERTVPGGTIYSHIDLFRNRRVQGWALRAILTPEGPRLLGCCTIALAHDGHIVTQSVADIPRPDVAEAMQGEERCGFLIEVPRSLLAAGQSKVFRLFVMPERRELTGSPCVLAPSFAFAHG